MNQEQARTNSRPESDYRRFPAPYRELADDPPQRSIAAHPRRNPARAGEVGQLAKIAPGGNSPLARHAFFIVNLIVRAVGLPTALAQPFGAGPACLVRSAAPEPLEDPLEVVDPGAEASGRLTKTAEAGYQRREPAADLPRPGRDQRGDLRISAASSRRLPATLRQV